MYQGRHGNNDRGRAPRRPRMSRTVVVALALVLVLGAAIGGTIAYLVTHTNAITNTFTPGETTPGIEENVDHGVKKSIVIQNKGNIPAYIRVMLVGNTVDEDNVTGGFDVSDRFTYNSTDWVKGSDGYYYYKQPVAANAKTSNLLGTSTITVANGETVTVLAQSIQAEPTSVVKDTWNVTLDATGKITGTN